MQTATQFNKRLPVEPDRLPETVAELDELLVKAKDAPRQKWDVDTAIARATARSNKLLRER